MINPSVQDALWILKNVDFSNVMKMRKMVKAKGWKVGKSQMWNLLRNPIYCGRIFVSALQG